MNNEPIEELPQRSPASWKTWLFTVPWWGIIMVTFCGAALSFAISESTLLLLGIGLLSGLFSFASGLLMLATMLVLLPTLAAFCGRLLGMAKHVPRPQNSRLVKFGALMLVASILVTLANMLGTAIPAANSTSWTSIPLVNHEELWIETPGNWELKNSNARSQHYYDALNDLTISVSVVPKTDLAVRSLQQLPDSIVSSLRQSLKNVKRVSAAEEFNQGRSELRTEYTGVGAEQSVLHYVVKHVDLGDCWLEFQIFGFPSQIENSSERIDRFLNSLHSPK